MKIALVGAVCTLVMGLGFFNSLLPAAPDIANTLPADTETVVVTAEELHECGCFARMHARAAGRRSRRRAFWSNVAASRSGAFAARAGYGGYTSRATSAPPSQCTGGYGSGRYSVVRVYTSEPNYGSEGKGVPSTYFEAPAEVPADCPTCPPFSEAKPEVENDVDAELAESEPDESEPVDQRPAPPNLESLEGETVILKRFQGEWWICFGDRCQPMRTLLNIDDSSALESLATQKLASI